MNHTRKNLAKDKVEIKVTQNAVDLAVPRENAIQRLSKNIKVPGFREGKVPAHIAEKHLNQQQLTDEVVNAAINAALTEVLLAEQIQPLDQPHVNITKFVPFDTLEYTITIPIVPAVKLGGYMNLKAKREKTKVEPADIDSVIDNIRTQFAEKKAVKRAVTEGDEVILDFVGEKDGKPFDGGSAKDFALVIGSKQFIPGFEEGLVGHKAGEKLDLPLTFPKDYHAEGLKGAKAVFKVEIKKVSEVAKPELDNKLAEKITGGQIKDVKVLKDDIKRELTQRSTAEATERYKGALLAELVKKSTVEAPQILIDDQMKALENDFVQNLKYRGQSEEQYFKAQGFKDHDDWAAKELKPQAEQRVKNGLVLAELARAENVEVSDAEIDARQKQIVEQYNDPKLVEHFKSPETRRQIANDIAIAKALDKLVAYNG
jgi:trigger factor